MSLSAGISSPLFLQFILVSSVFTSLIENECLSNTDCRSNFTCDIQTKRCRCSKPAFWHQELQICSRCPLNWLEFASDKCLFFDNYSSSLSIPSHQTKRICQSLLAQPIHIVHLHDLNQFKDLLNQSLDNHQSVWIDINPTSINSSLWCNERTKPSRFDCLQVRKDQHRVCFEYVSCFKPAYFICEFTPIEQSEAILDRFVRTVTLPHTPAPLHIATHAPLHIGTTTKKPSRVDYNNAINQGASVISSLADAFGSIFGKKDTHHTDNSGGSNINIPQALSGNDDGDGEDESAMGKFFQFFTALGAVGYILLVLLILGPIIIIIVVIVVCTKQKPSRRQRSDRSMESYTSEAEYD